MSPPDRQNPPRQGPLSHEPGEHDPAEIWGRRIGRGLGMVALAGLAYWLGRQLQIW